ncbi:MAG: 50S ribosomal protein L29 [Elusimicrobia bacterium RIFOXYA2_FULL_50_26]|nr:MAG: 50S ribosomal protein L29 [Elusimicrobia bacterium RIFOXYA2_FULL_50_26]OGS25209.1 MAG: 50S ribosomal protein L29 [Elusimicrobia bacterium RIFOXYB2_FULL_50_12]
MKHKIWQETKNLSVAELDAKLRESEEQLFRMRFRHSSAPLKNPLEIRNMRRTVAQLKTLLNGKAKESK